MTTWRGELHAARLTAMDYTDIAAICPQGTDVLDVEFDGGPGLAEGPAVLIFTEDRVYFPVTYDGMESLASAPRNPVAGCRGQQHVGGE